MIDHIRYGQYRLRAMMTATLIVGVLLAFGGWAGANRTALDRARAAPGSLLAKWALAIEAVVLALMIGAAARACRCRCLLASRESLTWLGGIWLLTAGFYQYDREPRWTRHGPFEGLRTVATIDDTTAVFA